MKNLLADETVPADLRRRVLAPRRVVKSYPQLWVRKRNTGEEPPEE